MFDYEYWGTNTLPISQNMAMEEYLLSRSAASKVATVRFWNAPKDSVVIGYGESKANIKHIDQSFDLARRITGGSHVEFDKACIAYSFTVPRDGSFKYFNDMRKYFADILVNSLEKLGVEDVYADNRASTVNVDQKVIASHAIFWGVDSALLHGLLLVDHYEVDKIFERMLLSERRIGRHTYSEYDALKSAPAASEIIKKAQGLSGAERTDAVKRMIADVVLLEATSGAHKNIGVTEDVLKKASRLVSSTHSDSRWLDMRTPQYKKEEVDAIPGESLDGKLKENLGYCMYIEVDDRSFSRMTLPKEELHD